jgi:hypothetical protein
MVQACSSGSSSTALVLNHGTHVVQQLSLVCRRLLIRGRECASSKYEQRQEIARMTAHGSTKICRKNLYRHCILTLEI